MLGIGGALQNPFQRRPPSDKHMENVKKINSLDISLNVKGDQIDNGEKTSSSRKRKREKIKSTTVSSIKKAKTMTLSEVIIEAKSKMQSEESRNGVTFVFMGSSGCGKSTVIIKVFIEQIFGKSAVKARGEKKEFIIQIFTLSAKSDAFKECPKDVLVDDKGLDEDNINFCYQMNEHYDKVYNFFIGLDDVLDLYYKELVQRMFLTMRNTNISSLISIQYPKLIPVSIRTSVYFALFFLFNNDEATEQAVRGWLSSYLPGKSIREKILAYREWCLGNDGHNMFLMDNLNHKCYKVDSSNMKYLCIEIFPNTSTNI